MLASDELIPVEEVRQACKSSEPTKNNGILFRGQQGLGVWKLAVGQSPEEWHAGGTGEGLRVFVGTAMVSRCLGSWGLRSSLFR